MEVLIFFTLLPQLKVVHLVNLILTPTVTKTQKSPHSNQLTEICRESLQIQSDVFPPSLGVLVTGQENAEIPMPNNPPVT